ncbi:MAG: PIN domain-containing protein [Nonlabens sp.]
MKVFLDNNIIIDLLHENRNGHKLATRVLDTLLKKQCLFIVTPLTIANAHYILKAHYKVLKPVKRIEALTNLGSISIMDESQVKRSYKDNWKDFEDSLQYQSALEAKCDCIITNDKKGFKQSTIDVYSPIKFLEEYK